jgi:hypothetical protein
MRYVLPVQDVNVRAIRKRFQLSYCRLLSLGEKGFIAQVGAEGYDASVTIMDLLAMHGNDVAAPLNITPHYFLVLFKEAAGLTTIPTPTVDHSMTELIDKINGTPPLGARGQEDGSSTTTAAANAAAVAATTAAVERLTVAKSAVAEATTQKYLIHAIAKQAQTIAEEAAQRRAQAHEGLAETRRERTTAIDPVSIATATEAVEVMEVMANKMEHNATTKGNIAYGASILAERACNNYYAAINALNSLRVRESDGGGSTTINVATIGTQGKMTTPCSTSTLSTTPTSATATVTPGTIIPGNPYVQATSLLHKETTAAIHGINETEGEDVPMESVGIIGAVIGGRAPIINALKGLIDEGILVPLKQFHACIVINKQERRIPKATIEPNLEQAAAQIAAIVEAERPANCPTLKGLIHDDVDKTTEELRRRVQSLKAKLMAKNRMGDDKRSKMKDKTGTVAAPSSKKPVDKKTKATPKRTKATPKKTPAKSKPPSPAASNSASNTAAKKQNGAHSKNKSSGKKRRKPTATRK